MADEQTNEQILNEIEATQNELNARLATLEEGTAEYNEVKEFLDELRDRLQEVYRRMLAEA